MKTASNNGNSPREASANASVTATTATAINAAATDAVIVEAATEKQKVIIKTFSASDKAGKFHGSKNLHIVKSHKQLTVTCPSTGIVSLLDIPFIPGFSLTYDSPLAEVSNARGIVQRGRAYLLMLEPQILAGLLLTIAGDYELFRTDNASTGASNNAILRSAGKEVLVEALLLIESFIHSNNSIYIPKFSLILSGEERQHSIQSRLSNWLKLAAEATVKPDLIVYDENKKPEKITFASVQKTSVKKKQELSAKVFAKRILAQDKKLAKALIPTLKAASKKMKAFLEEIFKAENLVTADRQLVSMLAEKLLSYGEESADRIAELLTKNRDSLKDLSDPFALEELFPETVSTEQKETREATTNAKELMKATAEEETTEAEAGKEEETTAEAAETEEMPSFSNLPPFQRILAKKKWLAAQPASVQAKYNGKMEKKEEPKFSSPPLSIPAPSYVPSPEKQKLMAIADKADELEHASLLNKIQKSLPSIDLDKMDDAPF